MLTRRAAIARAARVARAAGLPSSPVTAPDVPGVTNHVMVLGRGQDRVVARVPVTGHADFELERWCMRAAAAAGVPVPEVLACEPEQGLPVMLQRFVPHGPAVLPAREQWRVLGELARRTADVPLPADAPAGLFDRFGRDLPSAWQQHVAYNRDSLGPTDALVGLGVYEPGLTASMRDLVDEAGRLPLRFGLRHGDLFPRNLRVDAAGRPVLIDWGGAAAGPAPFADLCHVLDLARSTGEADSAAVEALLAGWGEPVPPRAVALMELVWTLDLVRWALARAPDRIARQVAAARFQVGRLL
jgi:aminoglycoside phosphotransferase (APT) family kinase protein